MEQNWLNTLYYELFSFPSSPTDRQIANANHLFFSSLAESALSGGGAAAASARRRANRGCTDANIFPPGRAFVRRLAGDGGTLFVRGLRKMTDRSFSDIPSSTMRELSGCMISHSVSRSGNGETRGEAPNGFPGLFLKDRTVLSLTS